MKPLILFTAMTVIGLFGIIGTVEYAHAQTPLTIPPPPNTPEPKDGSLEFFSTGITNTWIGASNETFTNTETTKIGHIHFKLDPLIEPHPLYTNVTQQISCTGDIRNVKTLLTVPQENNYIPNLAVPDNITPQGNDNIHAIGIDLYTLSDGSKIPCTTPALETTSKQPLIMKMKKELRITITDKHDKKPYYFSPRENILQAQPIPLCTTDTIDTTKNELKGNTKMCYGKNGNDMVIITKKPLGLYGTAETITTPDDPIALDSNVIETKSYVELLKRLYLPAI